MGKNDLAEDDLMLRDQLRRLRAADRRTVPPFEETVRRVPADAADSQQRLSRAAALVISGALLASALLLSAAWKSSPQDVRISPDEGSPAETTAAPYERVKVDFEEMRLTIDELSVRKPHLGVSWRTPTDSLLAVNLNVSLPEE